MGRAEGNGKNGDLAGDCIDDNGDYIMQYGGGIDIEAMAASFHQTRGALSNIVNEEFKNQVNQEAIKEQQLMDDIFNDMDNGPQKPQQQQPQPQQPAYNKIVSLQQSGIGQRPKYNDNNNYANNINNKENKKNLIDDDVDDIDNNDEYIDVDELVDSHHQTAGALSVYEDNRFKNNNANDNLGVNDIDVDLMGGGDNNNDKETTQGNNDSNDDDDDDDDMDILSDLDSGIIDKGIANYMTTPQ